MMKQVEDILVLVMVNLLRVVNHFVGASLDMMELNHRVVGHLDH